MRSDRVRGKVDAGCSHSWLLYCFATVIWLLCTVWFSSFNVCLSADDYGYLSSSLLRLLSFARAIESGGNNMLTVMATSV